MIFRKTSSNKPVINYLVKRITRKLLDGGKVFWLLSGSSYINTEIRVSKKLGRHNLNNLAVSLTDERYGQVGHHDSNWQKLCAGGFDLPGANLQPILQGKSFDETMSEFAAFIEKSLQGADYKIACVGVGADGHTLGVLKNSPVVHSQKLVEGYQGSDFKRITLTLSALKLLDEIVVYMPGENKKQLVEQLAHEDVLLDEQPAQALKRATRVIVYNENIGESA